MSIRFPGMTLGTARAAAAGAARALADAGATRARFVGFAFVLGSGVVLKAIGLQDGNVHAGPGTYVLTLLSPPPPDATVRAMAIGGAQNIAASIDGQAVTVTGPQPRS